METEPASGKAQSRPISIKKKKVESANQISHVDEIDVHKGTEAYVSDSNNNKEVGKKRNRKDRLTWNASTCLEIKFMIYK